MALPLWKILRGKVQWLWGNFDGVHCGHRYLIEHMALEAEKRGLYSVVTFFHPHPIEFFRPQSHKYLQTDKDKLQRISSLKPDASLILTFDDILAEMSPRGICGRCFIAMPSYKIALGRL